MTIPWKLKALFCGKITVPKSALTPGMDLDIVFDGPYLAFLLQGVGRNVLVDTGISEKFIVDGKAWGGLPAEGGADYLLASLDKAEVAPEEIDTVIFTHLHNDHAGNNTLFENAHFIFQKDEWKTLLDPLPVMQFRRDYDPGIIDDLKKLNCTMVDGDLELADGIKLFKTPGHTPGSQSIAVQTDKGLRVLVGDQWHHYFNGFSQLTKFVDLKGTTYDITPAPEVYGRFIPPSIVYNYYDWYDSCHKISALVGAGGQNCVVPGHEPSLLKEL
jgi:N-acyl homoserine lactone hydrolase